jgi:hypothetical protein
LSFGTDDELPTLYYSAAGSPPNLCRDLRVTDPHARYFGAPLEQRTLVTDETVARGVIRYANWLAGR